jgi:hypothetical protein
VGRKSTSLPVWKYDVSDGNHTYRRTNYEKETTTANPKARYCKHGKIDFSEIQKDIKLTVVKSVMM